MITIIVIIFFYIAPVVLTFKTAEPFVLLLTIGIWIFNTIILYYFCTWWDQVGSTTPKLSYRVFIKLYNVMPEDFTLSEYDIHYKNILTDFKTFSDWWQYRCFYKKIEKCAIQLEQTQRQAALVLELQRGLEQEQTKTDKFIKEHLDEQAQFFSSN